MVDSRFLVYLSLACLICEGTYSIFPEEGEGGLEGCRGDVDIALEGMVQHPDTDTWQPTPSFPAIYSAHIL